MPQRGTGPVFLFGPDVGGFGAAGMATCGSVFLFGPDVGGFGAAGMATCVLISSHSIRKVNGRATSPMSAGDSCLSELKRPLEVSEGAEWYALYLTHS